MKPEEQAAFVKAYGNNVAMIGDKYVANFVRRYYEGEDVEYDNDYASIMDALGMWNAALKWQTGHAPHGPDCPAVDGFGCRCQELREAE